MRRVPERAPSACRPGVRKRTRSVHADYTGGPKQVNAAVQQSCCDAAYLVHRGCMTATSGMPRDFVADGRDEAA
ncbi:MAG: hypothetical protein ACK52I_19940 [Pseudomonadota bacterium]